MRFGGWEILILVAIFLLLFGPGLLPRLGRALGQMVRMFRRELGGKEEPPAGGPQGPSSDSQGSA